MSINLKIQSLVLNSVYQNVPIPKGASRELKDVFSAKSGLCYDRSRSIEKLLNYHGFKTRHFSIFRKIDNIFKTLLTRGISSHSVTEVLTKKGWLIVDSNEKWISMSMYNNPISITEIRKKNLKNETLNWKNNPQSFIYYDEIVVVFGLYSRHGMFYEPYIFLPDIQWTEFISNLFESY